MSIVLASQKMKAKLDATSIVSSEKIYPLVADADVAYPFVVYSLSENAERSKLSLDSFEVEISIVGEDYNTLAAMYDSLKLAFDADSGLLFLRSSTAVNAEKPEEFIFSLNYELLT